MLRHRNIDRICAAALAAMLAIAAISAALAASGAIQARETAASYGARLFDTSAVHTIDIVIDNWEDFLATCTDEKYSLCAAVIDGEKFSSVAIRGKGNTSLSSVARYGNDRYSFKLEFDHYQSGKSYYGLDKLCLNNLIQDATCMKDYLAYTLMNRMGVPAPLCSFVKVSVNGEYWGLYLAVEAVEDAFLERNYGDTAGQLYKPDTMTMGGGKGNGGGFRMSEFREKFENGEMPEMPQPGEGSVPPVGSVPGEGFELPEGFEPPQGGGPGMGMGSSDAKLQYTDDDFDSYSTIFENAKTDPTDADKARLIASLKALNAGEEIESAVDVEEVIRYLVVHSFLVNGDSYTGSMIHNYYLYERDGVLSMLPWDYNLSMGAFSMGFGGDTDSATAAVNDPIDTPVSGGDVSDRPMVAWIFESEEYTARYHALYAEFMADIYESGWLSDEIARVRDLIAPYVETDPTAFFTYEEFEAGVEALQTFCALRCESVEGQLNGTIPATTDGQAEDASALVDASALDLSDMGEMAGGGGPGSAGRGEDAGDPGGAQGGFAPEALRPGESDADGFPGGPPSGDSAQAPQDDSLREALPLLAASLLALAAGLVFARRAKSCR